MKKTIGTYLMIIVVSIIAISCHKEEDSITIDNNYEYFTPRMFGYIYDRDSNAIKNAKVYIGLETEYCDEGGCWNRDECTVDSTTTDSSGYYDLILNLKNACDGSIVSVNVLPNDSAAYLIESEINGHLEGFDEDGLELNHTLYYYN